MKHMILVTSPPACGKSFITDKLARALKNCVYLDKDSLLVLSAQIFKVAGEPNNRSSQFFEENVRNYEYDAILEVAFEALKYNDYVLINAPFTREVKDPKYIADLRAKLATLDTKLEIVWVIADEEACHQRMIARNSSRDYWKLEHWDEYIKTRDFTTPAIEGLHTVNNSTVCHYRSYFIKEPSETERLLQYILIFRQCSYSPPA